MHGFTVGYWWVAGVFWAAAVLCSALVRGGTRLHHEAGQPEPLDEIAGGLIWQPVAVNFRGTVFTVQYLLPLMSDGASVILYGTTSANLVVDGGFSHIWRHPARQPAPVSL